MNTKPRDICSAAFQGDIERLRQLVVAAGVYTGRWQPPCHISITPAVCIAVDGDVQGGEGSDDGSHPPPPEIVSEDVGDELAELLSEEEMSALMAHPELLRLTKAYTLEGLDEETAAAAGGGVDEDGEDVGGELLDEAEEEAAEADRQAQLHDFLIFRCLFAEQRHRASVGQRLQQHGLLHVSVTPPVNMVAYGILFSCRERGVPQPHAQQEEGDDETAEEGAVHSVPATELQVRWQPCKRSRYAGTPLHWAVLARAHAMVDFLVAHGADETAGLTCLPAHPASAAADNGTSSSDDMRGSAAKVLAQLTPSSMALANESMRTLQTLTAALDARDDERTNFAKFCAALEARLERRKARYVQRRQMAAARRALQSQQQREEDERAAAAAEDGEGDGGDVEEGEDNEE